MMTDSADLTASELIAAYKNGVLSPVGATEDALRRIEQGNPVVNAFNLVDPDRTLAMARESERRWQRGEPCGLLDGVPVSIKDMLLTEGWPTLRGSRTVDPNQAWNVDSPTAARLREHGSVWLGKTTTPELGWKGVTDSPATGITRNPWNPELTPGGSSGGASAALALGMGPLAIGTDAGGSVRIPASFSGVFALKPTYGWVPHYPASAFSTLAHVGPMSRSVLDTALLLDVMTAPDPRDWSTSAPPATSFASTVLAADLRGLRIAFSPALGYVQVDPEVARLVAAAVEVFTELGAEVEEQDPGFTDPVEEFHLLWYSGAAGATEHLTEEQRELLDPGLRRIAEQGRAMSATDYLRGVACRAALGKTMGEFHQRFDLLVTPTMPITAFEAGRNVPPGWPGDAWSEWTPFTYPFNMTQQPAASVPCGFTSAGLPVGLQVVGPRWADGRVLAACHAFEQARPWHGRTPSLPS
jgi:aspartyl-tRNA(Asn)/glutamyl-tRNA(Gln) amidotransferase subunit A